MVDVRPVCFLHTGMGLVYACLLQLSNGIPRVCMSALQLVAPWNSSSVDMLRTISESIVKSAGSGSTSWSMELPNTRIWVHMDMGAWVVIYGCIYGMGHHMDVGARVLIWIWVHGNRMDMDAWVLTWIWVHGSSYMDAFPTPRISHFLTPMGTLRWTVIL